MTLKEYFDTHGYYFVNSAEQQAEVNASDWLRRADPDWFPEPDKPHNLYVHISVNCKEMLPCSLYKLAFPPPRFFKNEIVWLKLESKDDKTIEVLVQIERQIPGDRYEVIGLNDRKYHYVDVRILRRTFNINERNL